MILLMFAILIPPYASSQFDIIGGLEDLVPSHRYRIVKGVPCSVRDHPYMVSLKIEPTMKHICGGTILSQRSVLSAAHCVIYFENDPGAIWVVAGQTGDEGNIQMKRVKKVHIPPSYSPITMVGDLSVLTVESPFEIHDFVLPVMIYPWQKTDVVKFCPRGQIMGWGTTSFEDKPTTINESVMRCATVPVLSHSQCQKLLNLFMDRSKICALGDGEDACLGDSGGPMMCAGRQIGIISVGYRCGYKNHPGVYTRVDYHFNYIKRMMNGQSKCFDRNVIVYSVTMCLAYFIIDH